MLIIAMLFSCSCVYSWDGYNRDSSEFIEVEQGNLVRSGLDIEIYHWGDGAYHDEEVIDIYDDELETYDYTTGEYHTYEMD
jgi:hypothetical protein